MTAASPQKRRTRPTPPEAPSLSHRNARSAQEFWRDSREMQQSLFTREIIDEQDLAAVPAIITRTTMISPRVSPGFGTSTRTAKRSDLQPTRRLSGPLSAPTPWSTASVLCTRRWCRRWCCGVWDGRFPGSRPRLLQLSPRHFPRHSRHAMRAHLPPPGMLAMGHKQRRMVAWDRATRSSY